MHSLIKWILDIYVECLGLLIGLRIPNILKAVVIAMIWTVQENES